MVTKTKAETVMKSTGLALTSLGLLLFALPALAQDASHGAQGYKLCAGCHGFKGEGSEVVNAPALAGQESWYLERQIQNFRSGIRGHAKDDEAGRIMSEMTRGLETDGAIQDIVAYIGTLPTADPEITVEGDVGKGRAAYAPCAACHGEAAEGNASLNAPALAHMNDWYQVAQLAKFKDGTRGSQTGDIYGMQMAPMAAVLADEQAMKDVVAYIASLNQGD